MHGHAKISLLIAYHQTRIIRMFLKKLLLVHAARLNPLCCYLGSLHNSKQNRYGMVWDVLSVCNPQTTGGLIH